MRFLPFALLCHLLAFGSAAAQSVLISELADPRLDYQTDRFIEIYNAGGSTTDLTGWSLVAVGNGGDIFTWNLSGSIDPGEALVAGDQTTTVAFPVDFPAEAWSTSNGTWNGKVGDGAKLLNASATLVDYVVVDGTTFENDDYVRDLGASPSTTWNAAEWTATAIDLPTEASPGVHGSGGGSPLTLSNIQVSPSAPDAGDPISVSVDVTDGTANITGVELRWGTQSGSLGTTIPMAYVSADTWATSPAIPGQSSGTTVYFEIEAFSDAPASEVSAEQSFAIGQYAPPAGYYASAEGLTGASLRLALHNIIDNHTVVSYSGALTVFETSDDKANGKVWDMYSDIPGGTPPYEYTFGVDNGSSASGEGQGYNREHSWPRSWFGGAVSPMNSDLFQLYPTDIYMNSIRGSFPYGEVSSPDYTGQNGTKRGPNTYPGYSGTVFEPIDAFKGDLARTYFYMATRYHTEDGSWPSSAATDGADLKPWTEAMLYEWHVADPVSPKELERNHVIYGEQGNRNPFIDRPEFAAAMFGIATSVGPVATTLQLRPNAPNPFAGSTLIQFQLDQPRAVSLVIYDVRGRAVRSLLDGMHDAGTHWLTWDGRDGTGIPVSGGTYFYRLESGTEAVTGRMVRVR